MGNIHETLNFMDIWECEQAQEVCKYVSKYPKNSWMGEQQV